MTLYLATCLQRVDRKEARVDRKEVETVAARQATPIAMVGTMGLETTVGTEGTSTRTSPNVPSNLVTATLHLNLSQQPLQ